MREGSGLCGFSWCGTYMIKTVTGWNGEKTEEGRPSACGVLSRGRFWGTWSLFSLTTVMNAVNLTAWSTPQSLSRGSAKHQHKSLGAASLRLHSDTGQIKQDGISFWCVSFQTSVLKRTPSGGAHRTVRVPDLLRNMTQWGIEAQSPWKNIPPSPASSLVLKSLCAQGIATLYHRVTQLAYISFPVDLGLETTLILILPLHGWWEACVCSFALTFAHTLCFVSGLRDL